MQQAGNLVDLIEYIDASSIERQIMNHSSEGNAYFLRHELCIYQVTSRLVLFLLPLNVCLLSISIFFVL